MLPEPSSKISRIISSTTSSVVSTPAGIGNEPPPFLILPTFSSRISFTTLRNCGLSIKNPLTTFGGILLFFKKRMFLCNFLALVNVTLQYFSDASYWSKNFFNQLFLSQPTVRWVRPPTTGTPEIKSASLAFTRLKVLMILSTFWKKTFGIIYVPSVTICRTTFIHAAKGPLVTFKASPNTVTPATEMSAFTKSISK